MLTVNCLSTRFASRSMESTRFSASRWEVQDAKAGLFAQPTTEAEQRRADTPNGCICSAQAGCQRASCLRGRVLTDRPAGRDSALGCGQPLRSHPCFAGAAHRRARLTQSAKAVGICHETMAHGNAAFPSKPVGGAGQAAPSPIAASTAEPSRRAAQPTARQMVPGPARGARSSTSRIGICRRRHGRLGAPT